MDSDHRAARRAQVAQHQRWGLLPPQTHGKGLLLLLLMTVPLAAIMITATISQWPSWGMILIIFSSLSGIALSRHTKQWLDEQIELETSD